MDSDRNGAQPNRMLQDFELVWEHLDGTVEVSQRQSVNGKAALRAADSRAFLASDCPCHHMTCRVELIELLTLLSGVPPIRPAESPVLSFTRQPDIPALPARLSAVPG